ncbi:MAG: hypothetical protein Q9177_004138, partial [Variospora cf. flavescens]
MSSNRRILPLQTSSSHSSPSNTQTEISPGAGQNGMANGNGMQVSSGTGESGDSLGRDDASRKRRTPGLVAAIACTECRRARQK